MAKHLLDWWKLRCSCRWGWCSICNATQWVVNLHNDLINLWLDKEIIIERQDEIKGYVNKIDKITLYEYLKWMITKEEFDVALEEYKPSTWAAHNIKQPFVPLSEPNPKSTHEFDENSVWAHCIYCWVVKKYWNNKPCSRYIWNIEEENNEES